MISSSCSTTITVLPKLRRFFSTSISNSVSFGCKPILGSSKMYIEPTKLLPNEVAKFIRCDSPPESVAEFRFNVKYSRPTLLKNAKRLLISINNRLETVVSYSDNFKSAKNGIKRLIDKSTKSEMVLPPT